MKQLTYIMPNIEGGVASFVYNIILYSDKSKFKNTVILLGDNGINSFKRKLPDTEVIKFIPSKSDTLYIRSKKLAKLIPENSIIISNDGGLEIDTAILQNLNNPLIYIVHGDFSYYYNVIAKKNLIIDTFITVSKTIANKGNEILKQQGSNKKIIPIFFPIPSISPNSLSIKDSVNIIFTGSLTQRKGIQYFPSFIEALKEKNISFKFTIVGSGPLQNTVIKLAERFKQVQYIGQKSNNEVISLLQQHHIFFLPSLAEGLPVSIVEAMKAGLVTITNNLESGIPEIMNPDRGFVFEPGDITGYVSAVKKLAKNPDLFNKMSANAISFANKNFDPIIQTKKYLSVISNTKKTISTRKSSKYIYMKLRSRFPDNLRIKLAKLLP